ncbi:MAG: hypothetical protein ACRDRH_23475 [Pseudonocardia sp.]
MNAKTTIDTQSDETVRQVLDEVGNDTDTHVARTQERVREFLQENNVSMMGGWT